MTDTATPAPSTDVEHLLQDPRARLLDDDRLTAVGLLFEVTAALTNRFMVQITAAGLSLSEFEVLVRLSRSPQARLRMSDLAAQANLSSSGLTRLVDRLETRGVIERRACSSDGRGSYAVLTPKGMDLLLCMLPEHVAEIEDSYTGTLTPTQLDAMLGALRTIRAVVRPEAEAGAADCPDEA